MKVVILENFEGYPNGDDKDGIVYLAGDKEIEVPDAFGEMIVKKGHAKAAGGSASSSSRKPASPAPAAGDA